MSQAGRDRTTIQSQVPFFPLHHFSNPAVGAKYFYMGSFSVWTSLQENSHWRWGGGWGMCIKGFSDHGNLGLNLKDGTGVFQVMCVWRCNRVCSTEMVGRNQGWGVHTSFPEGMRDLSCWAKARVSLWSKGYLQGRPTSSPLRDPRRLPSLLGWVVHLQGTCPH